MYRWIDRIDTGQYKRLCKKNAIPIPLQPPFSGTGFERYNPPLLCSHMHTISILKCAVSKSNHWVGFIFLELSFLYSQQRSNQDSQQILECNSCYLKATLKQVRLIVPEVYFFPLIMEGEQMVVLQSSAVKLSDVLPTCGVSAEWFLQQGPSHLLASSSAFLGFCFLAHQYIFFP